MNPKCPDALAFMGRGFQEKEITLFTHAHIYFFNVYLCIYIFCVCLSDQYFSPASPRAAVPQQEEGLSP